MQTYMQGGMKINPLMQAGKESYGCCPAPHCETCDTKPTTAKYQKEETVSKQLVSTSENPKTATGILYDSREAPVSAKIDYSIEQPKQTPTHSIQPYQEKLQQTPAPKTASSPKEVYALASSPIRPTIVYTTAQQSLQIASIADKVAYKGKGPYSVKPTEPKTTSPNQEQSLFSAFKAYASSLGAKAATAVILSSVTPAFAQQAAYTKLEQAVSSVKIESAATVAKPSTLDTYVASHTQHRITATQTDARNIVQITANSPVTTAASKQALSLEQTATVAYQSAQKTKQTAPIPAIRQIADNNAYRLLPWLFGSKKSSEEKDSTEKEPKNDYAKSYSTEQKVYKAPFQEIADGNNVKKTIETKEKTISKNEEAKIVVKETPSITVQAPKKKIPSKKESTAKGESRQESTVSRSITSERSRAELMMAAENFKSAQSMLPLAQHFR